MFAIINNVYCNIFDILKNYPTENNFFKSIFFRCMYHKCHTHNANF